MRKIVLVAAVLVFFWGFLGMSMASEDVSLDTLLSDSVFRSAYEAVEKVDSAEERNKLYQRLADKVYKKFGKNSKEVYIGLYTKDLEAVRDHCVIAQVYLWIGRALRDKFKDEVEAMIFFGKALGTSKEIPDVKDRSQMQSRIILEWAEDNIVHAVKRTMERVEDPETRASILICIWGMKD